MNTKSAIVRFNKHSINHRRIESGGWLAQPIGAQNPEPDQRINRSRPLQRTGWDIPCRPHLISSLICSCPCLAGQAGSDRIAALRPIALVEKGKSEIGRRTLEVRQARLRFGDIGQKCLRFDLIGGLMRMRMIGQDMTGRRVLTQAIRLGLAPSDQTPPWSRKTSPHQSCLRPATGSASEFALHRSKARRRLGARHRN